MIQIRTRIGRRYFLGASLAGLTWATAGCGGGSSGSGGGRSERLEQYVAGSVSIAETEYIRGSDWIDGAGPAHTIRVSAFRVASTLVTVGLWREYLKSVGGSLPAEPLFGWVDENPMTGVSWRDIAGVDGTGGFIGWVRRTTGVAAALPSEAQWECVARDKQTDRDYPWGDQYDDTKLWSSVFVEREGPAAVNRTGNVHVTSQGVRDLVGNVFEFCRDNYGPYDTQIVKDPVGTVDADRAIRGGGWSNVSPDDFRIAWRVWSPVDERSDSIGFRLVFPASVPAA